MSIFYDPKSRKPKVWIYIFFVVVPILILAAYMIFGQQMKNNKPVTTEETEDVFKRF